MIMMSSIYIYVCVYIYIYVCIYVYVYIYEHRSDDGIWGKFLSGFQLFSGILLKMPKENAGRSPNQMVDFRHTEWYIFKVGPECISDLQIQSELKRNPQVLGNDVSTPKVKKVWVPCL